MQAFPRLRLWIRALTRRPAVETELDEELRFHLEQETAKNLRAGLSPAEARRAALVAFGGVERHKEAVRDGRGVRCLEDSAADVRYALRVMRLRPGLAASVVLLLALGIGANAAMFGIVDRLLLRPPAGVRDARRVGIFYFRQTFPWSGLTTQASSSYQMYALLQERARSLESVGAVAYGMGRVSLGRGERAEPVNRAAASGSFFRVLGVEPRLGRLFTREEDRVPTGAPVVLLSDAFWRGHFAGDRGVLGRTVQLGAGSYTIVGVLPPGFTGLDLQPVNVWTPLGPAAGELLGQGWELGWGDLWLMVVARLRPGVTAAAAEAEATGLFRQGLVEEDAEERAYAARSGKAVGAAGSVDPTARAIFGPIVPARAPDAGATGKTARVALWLAAVAMLVLLIACANVANLLLARALARRKETAVRLALGVSRGRLLRQLLVETLVLAAFGGGAAVAVAAWGGALVRRVLLPGVDWQGGPVNGRVLLVTGALVVLSTLLAGLAPAAQSWRGHVADALKSGGRGGAPRRSRMRGGLVVAQAALTVLLLVGAGLFLRSLWNVLAVPRGYDPEHALLVEPGLGRHGVPPVEAVRLTELAAGRLRHLPGIREVALTSSAPFAISMSRPLRVPGVDSIPIGKDRGPYIVAVSPEYFRTIRTPIVAGRGILESDRAGAPRVAVVSATMGRLLWPGGSALGKCIQIGGPAAPCTEVVGVAGDALRQSLETTPVLQYYVPLAQHSDFADQTRLLVGTTGPAEGSAAAIRRNVLAVSPEMPYPEVRPLTALIAPRIQPWRLGAALFTLFGLLALLVAGVGLYGVIAYDVAQRAPEMAIRMAMGAPALRVVRRVVRDALRLALAGIALGGLAALVAAPAAAPLLFHESPRDPAVFATVAGLLLLVGAAAALVPARRASRLDPASALRAE